MWAIEDSPGPKAAYRGSGIILTPAILQLQINSNINNRRTDINNTEHFKHDLQKDI